MRYSFTFSIAIVIHSFSTLYSLHSLHSLVLFLLSSLCPLHVLIPHNSFHPHPQLGTHLRGKKKREELTGVIAQQRKAAAAKKAAETKE